MNFSEPKNLAQGVRYILTIQNLRITETVADRRVVGSRSRNV